MQRVLFLGIPVDVKIGTRHGVFKADEDGNVVDFIQKGSEFTLNEQGFVTNDKGKDPMFVLIFLIFWVLSCCR